LRERSWGDLKLIIAELEQRVDERDQEIAERDLEIEELVRENARLKNELAFDRASPRQFEGIVAPTDATIVRPSGEPVVHAVSRDSYEIAVPVNYGHPDYTAWARLVATPITELSVRELDWLFQDNHANLDALETAYPGAGVRLTERIRQRIGEVADRHIVDHAPA